MQASEVVGRRGSRAVCFVAVAAAVGATVDSAAWGPGPKPEAIAAVRDLARRRREDRRVARELRDCDVRR
jgi:hypothetical protein